MVQMSDREGCERVIRMLGNTKLHDGKIQLRLVNRSGQFIVSYYQWTIIC